MEPDLAVFGACADPTRLRLLLLLRERELCVCELVAVLQMPQGKVSRHLAVLRQAGLVRDRREGTWIHYSLAAPDSQLTRALRAYLRGDAAGQPQAVADRDRLLRVAVGDLKCAPATACQTVPRRGRTRPLRRASGRRAETTGATAKPGAARSGRRR